MRKTTRKSRPQRGGICNIIHLMTVNPRDWGLSRWEMRESARDTKTTIRIILIVRRPCGTAIIRQMDWMLQQYSLTSVSYDTRVEEGRNRCRVRGFVFVWTELFVQYYYVFKCAHAMHGLKAFRPRTMMLTMMIIIFNNNNNYNNR